MVDQKVMKKNILYNSIGNFIYLICQWVMTVAIVWLSGYNDAGILSLCMSISNTIYSISSFSMRGYQSSDLKNDFNHSEYFKSRVITCLVANIVCIIFLIFTNYSIYTKLCIFIYNIYKTSEAVVDVLHGEEQKKWRLDIVGISFGIRGIITIATFAIVLLIFKNILLSIILMTILVYIFIYLYDFKNYRKVIGKFSKVNYKKVAKLLWICLPITIYGVISNSVVVYPKLVLEKELGSEMLGIYSSIYSPITIIQVASMFIFNPLITVFADYYINGNRKEFYKLILKVTIIIFIIAIIGLIGINLFGKFGLSILYGKKILKYSYILNGLVIVAVITAFTWFLCNILVATRKPKILLFGSILSFLTSLVLSNILIPKYSMTGVNYTLIITLCIQNLFNIIIGYIFINKDFKKKVMKYEKNK